MKTLPGRKFSQSPALAACMSIIPGGGQLYLGQRAKGIFLLILTVASFATRGIGTLPLILIAVIDAGVLAKRRRNGRTIRPWEWFWSGDPKPRWKLDSIRKMGRLEQPIGTDTKVLDNSRSKSGLVRALKINREWSYSYTIERDKVHKVTDTTSLHLENGGKRSRTVEQTLQEHFGYTEGEKKIYEETTEVKAPPRTKVTVLFHWKNILEVGMVVLRNQSNQTVEIPYSIVIGVTFDQEHIDETKAA